AEEAVETIRLNMAGWITPSANTSRFGGMTAFALPGLLLLLASAPTGAQSFYQLTNPRIYRVDPPTNNPWYHGYGFGGLAWRPVSGNPDGVLMMIWETPPAQRGDLLELRIAFGSPPNSAGANDAAVLSQVLDFGWCYDMDYESDERVLVHSRFDYTGSGRSPGSGVGRFVRRGEGIVSFEMTKPYGVFQMGPGERMRGAFAGTREVAGQTYDTIALVKMDTTTAGIFLLDIRTGELIDADPAAPNGDLSANPYIGLAGETGVTNITNPVISGKTRIVGLDVIGDIAFVLFVPDVDAPSATTSLMQLDLLTKQVLAVADVSRMFDPERSGRCVGYTWGFDVSPLDDGRVRVLISDCTDHSLTSLAAIDGVNVPAGSEPVDPAAVYIPASDSGNGGTPSQPSAGDGSPPTESTGGQAVVWVCPGIGLALPMFLCTAALGLSRRTREADRSP
ncbi:MAG: hypothetical protein ACPMAQ_14390, partial [Phycisphaerae bacterium]